MSTGAALDAEYRAELDAVSRDLARIEARYADVVRAERERLWRTPVVASPTHPDGNRASRRASRRAAQRGRR